MFWIHSWKKEDRHMSFYRRSRCFSHINQIRDGKGHYSSPWIVSSKFSQHSVYYQIDIFISKMFTSCTSRVQRSIINTNSLIFPFFLIITWFFPDFVMKCFSLDCFFPWKLKILRWNISLGWKITICIASTNTLVIF